LRDFRTGMASDSSAPGPVPRRDRFHPRQGRRLPDATLQSL